MNAFETIAQAIVAQLKADPSIADGQVQRGHGRPVPEGVDAAVTLALTNALPTRSAIFGGPIDWLTTFSIDCSARGSKSYPGAEVPAEQAALALYQAAWERLFANPTLSGAVMDMEPLGFDVDTDELDTTVATVRTGIRLRHRTAGNTLEV